jgi:3-hydroxyacyl-CoA dehydrogenase / enoyl-CoA hydratase / 3-hydroxybutyryl-CoA epimerase / enoyl-CoA isomerase
VQPRGSQAFSDEEIVERLMLPMIVEAATCLEEGVAETAAEIDMSLILALGFPRRWGGALQYADRLGLRAVVDGCARYEALGGGYRSTASMRSMADRGARFFS